MARSLAGGVAAIGVMVATMGTSIRANAQPVAANASPVVETTTVPKPPPTETMWYGLPIILTDVAATILVASGSGDGGALFGLGIATYVVGGPIVHVANRRPGRALGSVFMRLGLPLVMAGGAYVVSGGASSCQTDGCNQSADFAAIGGFALGMVAAMVLDSAALAYKPVRQRQSAFSVAPLVDRKTATTGISVQGTF